MSDIIYFVPGSDNRFINKRWKPKITIGHKIHTEGYYIGKGVEKEKCWIFFGKPYIPSKKRVPPFVRFNPCAYRSNIIPNTIRYYLVRHKKTGAHFVICSYKLKGRPVDANKYFADLLTFIGGRWKLIEDWPFEANFWHSYEKMHESWKKHGNYYDEDFEIIREIPGL